MFAKAQEDMVATNRLYQHHSPGRGNCGHQVQFYDKEEHLYNVLSDYFAPFLGNGEGWLTAIILGRAGTTKYIRERLIRGGYICQSTAHSWGGRWKAGSDECATLLGHLWAHGHRRVFLIDADVVISRLVEGNDLHIDELETMMKEMWSQLTPNSTSKVEQDHYQATPVYAYGELVDILCARGQHLLALELETFWNNFMATRNMTLLCGYKMDSFRDLQVEHVFDHICHSHVAVAPTERYSSLGSEEEKLTMIATLQVKVMKLRRPSLAYRGSEERKVRYREQFMDTMCHELRNPVSGIVGNVELLQTGLDVRQAILRPNHGGRGDKDIRLSNEDVMALQDQLCDDVVSVDAIAACAEHMKTLSDNVLSLSKLEEGKVELEKTSFDPKDTIRSVMKMFSTIAQKKGLQLHQDLPKDDFRVLGDPGRLAQVIVNLISNAIKFTNTGSITVQLRCLGQSRITNNFSTFKVVVQDTGRGLSQDEISTLFQRFSQPRSTSFAKDGGTGLGLYISKYLVELMGGAMYVESGKGGGSAFIFTFLAETSPIWKQRQILDRKPQIGHNKHEGRPLLKRNSTSPAVVTLQHPIVTQSTSDASEGSSPTYSLASSVTTADTSSSANNYQVRHVLVVDDNPIILTTFTRLLESTSSHGLTVSTASNGYEAIGKLIASYTSSCPVDFIFLDLDMPFIDGLKTTSEIRRLSNSSPTEDRNLGRLSEVPIIGLTGEIREERFLDARRHGMNECIQKPVPKAVLVELMDKISKRRHINASSLVEDMRRLGT
jgi:signal transduction histidine kinase/CheY-like chemotaxis protein